MQLFLGKPFHSADMFSALGTVVFVVAIEDLSLHIGLQALIHILFALDLALQREKPFLPLRYVGTLQGFHLLRKLPTKDLLEEGLLLICEETKSGFKLHCVGGNGGSGKGTSVDDPFTRLSSLSKSILKYSSASIWTEVFIDLPS